ncbi:hypothetical protein BDR26DRAFT_938845 [Obelidium mucronatum]|nr:hypothetical protein BDR26DRAFT_938845 [Obelidium mucronatum]
MNRILEIYSLELEELAWGKGMTAQNVKYLVLAFIFDTYGDAPARARIMGMRFCCCCLESIKTEAESNNSKLLNSSLLVSHGGSYGPLTGPAKTTDLLKSSKSLNNTYTFSVTTSKTIGYPSYLFAKFAYNNSLVSMGPSYISLPQIYTKAIQLVQSTGSHAATDALHPKKFMGSRLMDFDQFVRLINVLSDAYTIGLPPVEPVPAAVFPNPGPLPAGALGAGTANVAARTAWEAAWNVYTDQSHDNSTAQCDFVEARKRFEERSEKNNKACAILSECFSYYDMSCVEQHPLASVKIPTLRAMYNTGGLAGSSGTEETEDLRNKLTHISVGSVQVTNSIDPESLPLEFAGFLQNIASTGTRSFVPLLVLGPLPPGAPAGAAPPLNKDSNLSSNKAGKCPAGICGVCQSKTHTKIADCQDNAGWE